MKTKPKRLFYIFLFIIFLSVSFPSSVHCQGWVKGLSEGLDSLTNDMMRMEEQVHREKMEEEKLRLEKEKMQMERQRMQAERQNQDIRFWMEKGNQHMRAKSYEEALSAFMSVISLKPNFA